MHPIAAFALGVFVGFCLTLVMVEARLWTFRSERQAYLRKWAEVLGKRSVE